MEFCRVNEEKSRGIRLQRGVERRCRELVSNGFERFVRVGSKRGDEDERLHLGIAGRGTTDDGAAIRVANKHDVAGLPVDESLCRGDIGREAAEWILDRDDIVAAFL